MRAPSGKKWRVKRHPRFTVLDFGEYMAADAAPRETIRRDMKYERIGRTLLYDRLRRAIPRFLTRAGRHASISNGTANIFMLQIGARLCFTWSMPSA
jgi:hypothetical protein